MNVRDAVFDVLRRLGIDRVFRKSGSTELTMLAGVPDYGGAYPVLAREGRVPRTDLPAGRKRLTKVCPSSGERAAWEGTVGDGLTDAAWCAERDREAAINEFSSMGCAAGPLETVSTMLENPQILARNSVTRVSDPALGPLAMTNVFPRFRESTCSVPETGPSTVGQHTDELLAKDLGLSAKQIEELISAGICGNADEVQELQKEQDAT